MAGLTDALLSQCLRVGLQFGADVVCHRRQPTLQSSAADQRRERGDRDQEARHDQRSQPAGNDECESEHCRGNEHPGCEEREDQRAGEKPRADPGGFRLRGHLRLEQREFGGGEALQLVQRGLH
ncbi:hypothetical protein ATY41_07820 [Leifsonia xyli subsp. xyli]|uniref:Uncharacterized protein n=1 Tax=Leifsonia xyli subsp. xyli TaxID=59736 RepID=A0A1E2SMF4_LEIXY|nr:hypothetical protein ATY41_07820 [Leifsonia xyli subsp. xyli]